ncbi:MAG: hypothetical protein AB7E51_12400 [Pseudodesulfovibrio sp.]|jgi:hypothetical protein|uniref:Uncharacterized protein n=1 Tax=Pseudodesulfovibrio indicus TaxID=1716143 RepID=A0A126QKM7_9BACT|nr:hypothetical protein [Pseudodesulfovibrio indicus]AMK10356.1 hypothetical protein AWY79_04095 [Pseudodesulfovibrio indicus]TDT81958.1 hypothetical protein EDC59_1199 [Pseudodesulfovibrio indicus]
MKKVARTLSLKAVSTISLLVFLAGALPGCAVVSPLLTAGGIAFPPLQIVSAAYTLGEFTYEYAANDKTPDKVIGDKYDAVVSGEAFELPAYLQSEPAGPEAPVMVAEADVTAAADPGTPADMSLSAESRRKRIENLLGQRRVQFERLELRRMAFLEAQPRHSRPLSLSRTAMASQPDLVLGAGDEVSLD